jgi:AAA+ ATPase superfamily predicted ATPase
LYGRRRVGKSELLDHFIQAKGGVRLLAREEAEHLQLRHFSEILAEHFQDPVLAKSPFASWDAFFTFLAQKAEKRLTVAVDEFPYLVAENRSVPSLLQYHWDEKLRKSKLFLILCGSSIGMMEDLMGAKSPLYGRRTGQMLLQPLTFRDALPCLGEMRRAVEGYAVFGGTPAYLTEFDPRKSLGACIREKILNPERFLYRDAEFILREEVREPRTYFSILHSIAKGNTRLGQIIHDTGLDKGVVGKYIGVLCDLHLVEREVPVTERKPEKSRMGIYRISDNFIRFWFRFVFPHGEAVEQGREDWILKKVIRPQIADFVSPVFERIARETLWAMGGAKRLPLRLTKLGRWWEKDQEIDIVGIGEDGNLYCEVKWSEGVDAVPILERLKEKARAVGLRGRSHFCVVARNFRRRASEGLQIDLADMKALLSSH